MLHWLDEKSEALGSFCFGGGEVFMSRLGWVVCTLFSAYLLALVWRAAR